jgi:hypothetical protein
VGPPAHRHRDGRARQIGLAAGDNPARRDELVDRLGGQHHDVELLAGLHSLGRVNTAHRFEREFASAEPPGVGHIGQDLACGHRGDTRQSGVHDWLTDA